MQRGYRSGAFKKRRNVARSCARRRSRDERSMVKAAITESCWIGGNWHQCGVATKLSLHPCNCAA
jgi:hypothetical protein